MSRIPALGPRGEGWVRIQLVLFAAVGLAAVLTPGSVDGTAGVALLIAGAALLLAGGLLAGAGLLGLRRGSALTALPYPLADAELVTTGVFAAVRHPVYGGLVIAALGLALVRASLPTAAAALGLLVFFDLKRRREEAWLTDRFAGYAAYRRRTGRMIPWLY